MRCDNTMEAVAHITYNKAVEELRRREYPMLEGWFDVIVFYMCINLVQGQPTLTMPEPRSTRSR